MMTIITGMHRSGTSMVTRMLNICGLDLGPEEGLLPPMADNPAGFWEARAVVLVNEAVLDSLGAGWDYIPPDLEPGWEKSPRLDPLREEARRLIGSFEGQASWGWKDPRFCLTLPFWKSLLPDYKVVICLRHPIAVADSLLRRSGNSAAATLNLWHEYNRHLLQNTEPAQRVVTRYDTFFLAPQEELSRLLAGLGWSVPEEQVVQACETVSADLRHSHASRDQSATLQLPKAIDELFQVLQDECGSTGTDVEQANITLITEQVQAGDPGHPQSHFNLGVPLPESIDYASAGLAAKQQLLAKSVGLLKQAADSGSVESGLILAEKVFGQFTEQAQLLLYYGQLLAQQDDLEGAATYLKVALKYDGKLAAAHNDLAIISLELKNLDDAIQHLAEAARIEPGNSIYLENLADLNLSAGNAEEARKAYQIILENDPENHDVRLKLAQVHVQLGEKSRAVEICNDLIKNSPEHAGVKQLLSQIA